MLLVVLACSLALTATGQQDEDWIDPYDMLNYDSSTKTMRKPGEPQNDPNVPTKRQEFAQDSSQAEQRQCENKLLALQKQIEEQDKRIMVMSQQPTCNPVFKRFLSRLLKEIQRVGSPSDSNNVIYDAKIGLSKQSMTELQTLLEGEESWRTGALDNAVSQILVDLRPHDYEAWKWHFEDTFGVDLDTLLKLGLFVLLIVAIISTQLWSTVSWFMQFRRLFVVSFFISIIWNWFYLYKTAFAEHQKNMVKLNGISEKCTGVKQIDWSHSLKEWIRSTMTLQDDPCKKYYEVLFVNPLLLVPPTKAISVTIVTFITEPLKHIGEGISDFIRALLKDLPVTMQIPVFFTLVAFIVVFMYVSVHGAFQHGIMAPFRRPRRDPPPPQLQHPQHHHLGIEDCNHSAGMDAQHARRDPARSGTQVHRRRTSRPREDAAKVSVETLRTAAHQSEDETHNWSGEAERNLSAELDLEEQQEAQEEQPEAGVKRAQSNARPAESDSAKSQSKPLNVKKYSKGELGKGGSASQSPAEGQPAQTDVQDQKASGEDRTSSDSLKQVETIGVPVQETAPASE